VGEHSFLIHRVPPGEIFAVMQVTYVTRSKVILALNDSLSAPLKADTVIVIGPRVQTVNPKLPSFRIYEVTEETSIDELAQQLDVEPALLRDYNHCSNECRLAPGDWLMIPD